MEIGTIGLDRTGGLPAPRAPGRGGKPAPTAPAGTADGAIPVAAREDPAGAKAAPWGGGRPGRAHVQQSLHRLERLVRGAIEEQLAGADGDGTDAAAVRDLEAGFADSLRDAFHDAGRGHDFDRAALLSALGDAVGELTAGLASLREAREAAAAGEAEPGVEPTLPVESPPAVEAPGDRLAPDVVPAVVGPQDPAGEPVAPGGLLSLQA